MAWTAAQEQAITTRGKNLLTAAAAGSGKTAVLVERIIRLVTEENIDVDKLLVVTFTHAAAEEMTERIGAALSAKAALETDPQKLARLERQRVLLPSADISTLHSFCLTLLRQNILALPLEPDFRLGLTEELRLIAEDVLDELIAEAYEENRVVFRQLADSLADGAKDDGKLAALIRQIYDFALSRPFPQKWLTAVAASFNVAPGAKLQDTVWYKAMREETEFALTEALADNDEAARAADECGLNVYAECIDLHKEAIENALDALYGDFAALQDSFAAMDFKLKAEKNAAAEDKARVSEPRDRYKKALGALKDKYFSASEENIMADLRSVYPFVCELIRLTMAFAAKFAAAKREKNLADFADLEHYALKILVEDEERLTPSATALALREKFAQVMVDEYQDTNGVQETILAMIASPEKANLFVVGDVKQSIYRFRLADPTLFLEKYKTYPTAGEGFARIDLKQNFRSRREVLAAINFLFEQLMNEATMELSYDEAAKLYPGAEYPPPPAGAAGVLRGAELAVIVNDNDKDKDSDEAAKEEETGETLAGIEREAQFIADRLNALMAAGTQVFDKATKTYRPLKFRDAVVLMRSVKGRAEKMLEVFKRNGIPAYASMDAGYFAATEIKLMLALLAIIDNARQDIPLAAVLLSVIGGFSPAELAKIRTAARQNDIADADALADVVGDDLFAALKRAATCQTTLPAKLVAKVADFLVRLTRWRDLARDLSVPELIAELYRDTGYYDYAGSLAGGTLRQANLRMLIDRAAEYETTNFRSLFRFLRFVERMQNADTDLAVARTLSDSEDVLRIMTIHKSKGLEFPLVFLAAAGTKFTGESGELILHGELGLGPYALNSEGAFRYPTFARQATAYRVQAEAKAEELRVLYVALTRAREQLIVVGTGGTKDKFAAMLRKYARFGTVSDAAEGYGRELPPFAPAAADSFLAWCVMSIMRGESCGKALRDFAADEAAEAFAADTVPWRTQIIPASQIKSRTAKIKDDALLMSVKRGEKLPPSRHKAEVEGLLRAHYDFKGVKNVPAKLSVTELKRRFVEIDDEAANLDNITNAEKLPWKTPQFLRETRLTGADYGTIMHSVMQHTDLTGDLSPTGIRAQLATMRAKDIFSDEEIRIVNPAKVAAFFASPLGERLLNATEKYRELPFSQRIAAKKFFPEAAEDEKIFVQGVIDLLFADESGLVLVDYKTDRDTTPAKVRETYRLQIDLYTAAVESVTGKRVAERYLFMLGDGSIVAL